MANLRQNLLRSNLNNDVASDSEDEWVNVVRRRSPSDL